MKSKKLNFKKNDLLLSQFEKYTINGEFIIGGQISDPPGTECTKEYFDTYSGGKHVGKDESWSCKDEKGPVATR